MTNTNLRYESVKRSLQRWKSEKMPKIPTSIKELQAEFKNPKTIEKYGQTYEGDGAFYIDTITSPTCDFTIFASPFIKDFIEKNIAPDSRLYLMDGTFDRLPKGFYQMLTISIEHEHDVSSSFRS